MTILFFSSPLLLPLSNVFCLRRMGEIGIKIENENRKDDVKHG